MRVWERGREGEKEQGPRLFADDKTASPAVGGLRVGLLKAHAHTHATHQSLAYLSLFKK